MAVKRTTEKAKKTAKSASAAPTSRKPGTATAGRGAKPVTRPAAKPATRTKAGSAARPATTGKRPRAVVAATPVVAAKPADLKGIVLAALEDMKAVNATVLDVRGLTDIADTLIVASGNSDRHVRSIADRVIEYAKKAGYRPLGVEGERDGEWVLVDLQDVIVHIMLPRVREFYRLEDLWDVSAAARAL
jgi:ribosome-associated protein